MHGDSLLQLIADAASARQNAPAILAPECDPLTYGALDALIGRIGVALRRLGIMRGDRVSLVCANGPAAATAFLGIAPHAACAPLNPAYRASEFEFYLSDLHPRAVLVEAGVDSPVRTVAAALGIPVLEMARAESGLAGDIEVAGDVVRDQSAAQNDGSALLLHTSGTTSRPKLVRLTEANLCASAHHIAESLHLTSADRCLNVMPLFHIHGLAAGVLASLAGGGSVVCCPGFIAPSFLDWLDEFRPTWYTAVPTIHQSVAARVEERPDRVARHSLRFIRSCSSALAPSLMEKMEALFHAPMVEAYGMTEAAHQMASNPLPPGVRKPGSVGLPAGPRIAIMDGGGNLLERGAVGEVVIRGSNVTPGYAANPEANAAALMHGWFRTGDEGYLDPDGYLVLCGRRKEMINRGGEKIAPREIDEALLRHPAVSEAVAFSAPHSTLGETVAAAVVLRTGRVASEAELRWFAAESLADFKIPEKILFVERIPKGPSGKIQRIGMASRLGVEIQPSGKAAGYIEPRTKEEREIAALFAITLQRERIGTRDKFFDLGGDSLLAALLLARIRDATAMAIPMLTFLEDPTVCGVCRYLAAPPAVARPAGEIVTLTVRPGGGGPGLFCIPGSSGDLAGFFHLARNLPVDLPVTAFPFAGTKAARSIEEIAASYCEQAMTLQPEGPWHFLGVCTGGFIAYEMARQMSARGRAVGPVALLDCYNHAWGTQAGAMQRIGRRADLLRRRLLYQQRALRKAGVRGAAGYLRPKLDALARVTRVRVLEKLSGAGVLPGALEDATVRIRVAAARYTPSPFDGRVELFRAEEPRVDGYDYPEMGWRGLARGGIALHEIPGSHLTMLSDAQAPRIAERIRESLRCPAAVP